MIKRPFVGLYIGLVLGIIWFNHINNWIILGSVSVSIGALLFMSKKHVKIKHIILSLTIMVVVCGYCLMSIHSSKDVMVHNMLRQSTVYRGVLYGMDHPDNDQFILNVEEVFYKNDYRPFEGRLKLIVTNRGDALLNGEKVDIQMIQLKDGVKRNSVDFDYNRLLRSQGIDGYAYIKKGNIQKLNVSIHSILYHIDHLRNKIYTDLRLHMTKEHADVGFGMLLGDTRFIEKSIKTDFVQTGIAHVLAMSGLHFGILFGLAYYLRKKLLMKNDGWRFLVIICLWAVAVLNGFKPSAVRAVTMLTTITLAPVFSRRYDPLNVLAMIGTFSVLYEPLVIYQAGFQLSYVAVLSIVLIVPMLHKKLGIRNEDLRQYLSLIIGIQLGIAPVMIYHFNYFSFVSMLVNIPATALTTCIVPLGYLYIFILKWIPVLNQISVDVLGVLLELLKECSIFLSDTSFRGLYLVRPMITSAVLYSYFIVLIMCEKGWYRWMVKKRYQNLLWILMIPILLSLITVNNKNLTLTFWDVGQGDSVLIDLKGTSILIDTGEKEAKVYEKLLKSGVKPLDYLVLSHTHSDHAGGAVDILKKVGVKHIVMGASFTRDPLYDDILKVAKVNHTPITWMGKGDMLNLPFGLTVECLGPELKPLKSDDELNDKSLIMLMTYGEIDILFTGDLEEKGEADLLQNKRLKNIEIIKVPHHGSYNAAASKLIDCVKPQTAIILVGPNLYGHPNRAIIDLYENFGAEVFRTDQRGAITVNVEKDCYEVVPFINTRR